MNRQRGAIELIALLIVAAVVAASFAGLWAFYHTQNAALVKDNGAKQATITGLNTKLATSTTRVKVLEDQNKVCGDLVKESNASVAALRKERNDAWQGYNDAKAAAAIKSKTFQATINQINATKAGSNGEWCPQWQKLIEGYVQGRKTK